MGYFKPILALVFICLSLLSTNRIEGAQFTKTNGRQITDHEAKEGSFVEAQHSRVISNLFPNLIINGSLEYNIHHAGYFTPSGPFQKYQGTRARISVWGIPNVNYNSQSAVYIAVVNDEAGKSYSMVAGFHVNPSLYSGKTDLRLFAGWAINENTGCLNTNCQGFVLSNVTGAPVPGETLAPLSTFNGKDYFVTLSIKKDQNTQDWSLYRDDNNNPILIGWWPKTLFNNTFNYATKTAWAAEVVYPKTETSPPMGSGHASCEGANKAAYISNIKTFDKLGQAIDPEDFIVKEVTDRMDCFSTTRFKYQHGIGYNFFYGGPAGCNN